jgi:hypothetical protein
MNVENFLQALVQEGRAGFDAPLDEDELIYVEWSINNGRIYCVCQKGVLFLHDPESLQLIPKIVRKCLGSMDCGGCIFCLIP